MVLNRTPIREGEFAYCYPTVYNGFKNWTMFIEMIELNRMLGAEEIIIYDQDSNAKTVKTLGYYQEKTRLHFLNWRFPRELKNNVMCQRATLNDCLYRLMHRYDYVAVTDLDEVLVPRLRDHWHHLMKQIDKPERGAFLFQHAYFRRNYSLPADPYLITQTSFWRTDELVPPGKIRCKSMYKSALAVKLDLHFPYELYPGAQEHILPGEEGILHHYRKEPMETFYKYPERYNYIEDKFMQKFKRHLTNVYRFRLREIEAL